MAKYEIQLSVNDKWSAIRETDDFLEARKWVDMIDFNPSVRAARIITVIYYRDDMEPIAELEASDGKDTDNK